MSCWCDQAKEKLDKESKEIKGKHEKAMEGEIKTQLLDFCRQNEEFAQAVVQGGSFPDCMTAVAKGVGIHISDLEAYRRAVSFYFPGAKVNMQVWIQLEPDGVSQDIPSSGGILLDFSDLW